MTAYWSIILPEATTNIVDNPSFEADDPGDTPTGWTAGGSNTITQSTAQSKFGANSALCTDADSGSTLAAVYNVTLTASTQYTFSAWVYIDPGWDGGAVTVGIVNFTSATTDTASASLTTTGTWTRLEIIFTLDADATGSLIINTASPQGNSEKIYVDAVQCEALGYSTTYCDGDQPGCYWNGTPHASTSTRNALEATGGVVTDLHTTLGFNFKQERGTSMPTVETHQSPFPIHPGSLLEGQKIGMREIVFAGDILSNNTVTDFHDVKRALIRAFNSNIAELGQAIQPRVLRYTGADVDKEIGVVYDAGLEDGYDLPNTFHNIDLELRLLAPDPMFYQIGETASALDPGDSATFSYVAARESGTWNNMGNPSASAGVAGPEILCSARYEDTIYFGGDFTNFDGIANADYIVQYSISAGTFSALSTGVSSLVWDMVVDGTGILYIVGEFTNAGGDADADYVAQWNGSAFSSVGQPNAAGASWTRGYKCCIDTNGNLWVGGGATNIANIANADYIAYWDRSSWNAAGTGMNNDVRGLKPDNKGGVYATGDFTTAGGTGVNYVSYWDGSAWNAMGNGLNPTIKTSAIAVDENNFVYVGDTSTDVSSSPKICKWNGSGWEGLGTGLTGGTCYDMKLAPNGDLYIAGDFTTADGVTVTGAAIWNGTSFAPLDINLPGSAIIEAFEFLPNGDIYFGYDTTGTATYAGSASISYNGSARAYPYIKIKRSGGTSANLVAITNWTTKSTLYFNSYAILDGEELVIDTRPGKQSIISTFSGNRTDALLRNSHLGNFWLVPSNADEAMTNTVTMFIDPVGSPTMTVNMIWRDTYLSQD